MLDIKIMKWGCGLAEGFNIFTESYQEGLVLTVPHGAKWRVSECKNSLHTKCYYSLFLQRVKQGLIKKYGFQFDEYFNKKTNSWDIMFFNKKNLNYQEYWNILPEPSCVTPDNKDIDKGLEKAIKYIWEQLHV